MDNKLRKLAREIVEEVVDCDAADPEPVQQYLTWTEKKLCSALSAELEKKEKRIIELEADKRQLNEIINSEANRAERFAVMLTEAMEMLKEEEAKRTTPVRLPNEKAALAMFDIFYQTERNNCGNLTLGYSDGKALGEWITKALELRGAGFSMKGDEQ